MSYEKFFEKNFETNFGRRFDWHGYARTFPDRVAAWCRASGLSAVELALVLDCTERQAQNYIDGISRPGGWRVAVIAVVDEAGFREHFDPDREVAA